jgi:hypothetical protein
MEHIINKNRLYYKWLLDNDSYKIPSLYIFFRPYCNRVMGLSL